MDCPLSYDGAGILACAYFRRKAGADPAGAFLLCGAADCQCFVAGVFLLTGMVFVFLFLAAAFVCADPGGNLAVLRSVSDSSLAYGAVFDLNCLCRVFESWGLPVELRPGSLPEELPGIFVDLTLLTSIAISVILTIEQ